MKIKRIEFVQEITNLYINNLNVFVKNKDSYRYTIVVSASNDLPDQMEQEKINFILPHTLKIIVKKLRKEIETLSV